MQIFYLDLSYSLYSIRTAANLYTSNYLSLGSNRYVAWSARLIAPPFPSPKHSTVLCSALRLGRVGPPSTYIYVNLNSTSFIFNKGNVFRVSQDIYVEKT